MAGTIASNSANVPRTLGGLNGVRPRWPEQSASARRELLRPPVSMESGLDGRNNRHRLLRPPLLVESLNGVRPRWPEQSEEAEEATEGASPVSMESGLDGRNNRIGADVASAKEIGVSMESGLDGRNNQRSSHSRDRRP